MTAPQRRSNAGKRGELAAWRRVQVVRLSAEGLETKAIAERLGVSRNLVTEMVREAKTKGGGQ